MVGSADNKSEIMIFWKILNFSRTTRVKFEKMLATMIKKCLVAKPSKNGLVSDFTTGGSIKLTGA